MRPLAAVRRAIAERDLDALLVAMPENVDDLCGFDRMGYFACQALLVPADGTPVLVTRAVERATVAAQVGHLDRVGCADGGRAQSASCVALPSSRPTSDCVTT